MKLKNKVAIVTGSGHGLGHEIALAYAKEGAALVLVARSQNEIEAVANEVRAFGGKALAIPTDVSVEEQVNRMVQKTVDEFGRIDILVNNAGGPLNSYRIPMWNLALSDWQAVLDVNLTGTFLCSKAVLTHMMRQNSGVIINMSSGMGKKGKADMSAYSAAKFGVEGLTQSMALETSTFNIRVNALDPGGLTATPGMIKKNPENKPDQMLQPVIIGEVAVYLASSESVGVTGQSFTATIWNLDRQQIKSVGAETASLMPGFN